MEVLKDGVAGQGIEIEDQMIQYRNIELHVFVRVLVWTNYP